MGDTPQPSGETIEGVLERMVFESEDTGYCVARFQPRGGGDVVTITGSLTGLREGETLICQGKWAVHQRFGLQFNVESYEIQSPATRLGIIKYLGGGLIKGIGPKLAEKLVDVFGSDTLQIIDETPERLLEVPGIGESRLDDIIKAWTVQQGVREVMVFLQGHGLGASHAAKIFHQYGQDAVRMVKENPYRLSDEIFGIGFKTADRIAVNMGVEKDSPFRIRAAIAFLLEAAAGEGHLCLPYPETVKRAHEFLDVDICRIEEELDTLCGEGILVAEEAQGDGTDNRLVFTRYHRDAEVTVHQCLRTLMAHAKWSVPINTERAVAWAEDEAGLSLDNIQQEAVEAALTEPVLIITGGPGVGKTTIIRCVVQILLQKKFKLSLAAPTGRAAKRLSEAAGCAASTIHRLLGFNPHSFRFDHDEDEPLPCDVLIVDESSMIDVPLMSYLARAIRPTARLILVGDVDQLPSVGPGELLRSLIECGKFKVVRLTKLFRQAEGSGIIRAAHDVNQGIQPRFITAGEEGEVYFFDKPEPEVAARTVVEVVRDKIPGKFGMDPMRDVQVMTPMHKGPAGTENLNHLLQQALNPPRGGDEIKRQGRTFRQGDKVMQIKNNYNLNVFNGDIGFVERVDGEEGRLLVRMDEEVVEYRMDNLDELVHAYCISIHKSQGSEFPVVVMALLTQHFILLRRNLLYTAITRSRKLLVLVGSQKAVRIAATNQQTGVRYTRLEERLRQDSSF